MGVQIVVSLGCLHRSLLDPLAGHVVQPVAGDHIVGSIGADLILGDGDTHDDVVAVRGGDHIADLTDLQGQGGVLKFGDHLAGVGHGVTVGIVELSGGSVPAILAVRLHQLVEGGRGILGGADLGQEALDLLQNGGLLLVGEVLVGAVLQLATGRQEDMLGSVDAVLLHKVGDESIPVGLGHRDLAGLAELGQQGLVQEIDGVELLEEFPGDAHAVQHGKVLLLPAVHLDGVGDLLGGFLLLLGGEDGADLGGFGPDHLVELGGLQGLVLQLLGLGGPLLGGDPGAVDGQQGVVALDAGGLPAEVAAMVLLLGLGGTAREQDQGQKPSQKSRLFHLHILPHI